MLPALVIVEAINHEQWKAWFEDQPEFIFTGIDAESAIMQLFDHCAPPVQPRSIHRVDNGTKEGHFAYEVTFKNDFVDVSPH